MSRISVTVFKTSFTKESDINKIVRRIMKQQHKKYHEAYELAEKEFNPVQYTQVIHSNSKEVDLMSLGAHIANGAQFRITRS